MDNSLKNMKITFEKKLPTIIEDKKLDLIEDKKLELSQVFYGEVICASIIATGKRKGLKCVKRAKYSAILDGLTKHLCGIHCRKIDNVSEIPKKDKSKVIKNMVTKPKSKKLTKKQHENRNYVKGYRDNMLDISSEFLNLLSKE